MTRKILLMAVVVALALASCVKPGDVKVHGLESAQLEGLSKILLKLKVENCSGTNVKLSKAKFSLVDGRGVSAVDFMVDEQIVVPKRSVSVVEIPVRMKVNNPLLIMSVASNFPKGLEGYTLQGGGTAKVGMARKKIRDISLPVSDIIHNFDADMTKILNDLAL